MKKTFYVILFIIFAVPLAAQAQSYEYVVEHQHTLLNCSGTLSISADKIEYQTTHKEDARVWRYEDIQQIKVVSPTRLEITSYEDQKRMLGRDRVFKFKLLVGQISSEVTALFINKAKYPVATSVMPETDEAPKYEVAVKHLHTFGGCEGVLKVYPDRMTYESKDQTEKSRYWRWADIQSISRSGPFQFSITSYELQFGGPTKSFNFALKERMNDSVYDYLWERNNRVSLPALPDGEN